jgi:hypothetical protein
MSCCLHPRRLTSILILPTPHNNRDLEPHSYTTRLPTSRVSPSPCTFSPTLTQFRRNMEVNRRTIQRADYLQNAYTKESKCEKDHSMSRLNFCSTLSYHHGMWYKYHSHDAVTRIVARILRHRLPALRYRSPCPALTKILLKRSQEEQNITQPTQEKNPSSRQPLSKSLST